MRNITCLLLVVALAPACDGADLEGPAAEVQKVEANLDLPPVPEFELPERGGSVHNPRELRLLGRTLLDQEIEVKGYVTWIYDCLITGGNKGPIPGETDEEKKAAIAKKPTLCFGPHFVINNSPNDTPDTGIWVVQVPDAPRKDQIKARKLRKKEIEEWMKRIPQAPIGEEISVTGIWKLTSRGFANSRGLLEYKSSDKAELPALDVGPGGEAGILGQGGG